MSSCKQNNTFISVDFNGSDKGWYDDTISFNATIETTNDFTLTVTNSHDAQKFEKNSNKGSNTVDYQYIIAPGVILKVMSGKIIRVGTSSGSYGKLVVIGTVTNRIVFTSASPSPQKGDWNYTYFTTKTTAGYELNYCDCICREIFNSCK